jgi:hypothetical protein
LDHRQRTEEHRIELRKGGDSAADAQRQRGNGDRREGGQSSPRPPGVSQVALRVVRKTHAPRIATSVVNDRHAAGVAPGGQACVDR